MIDELATTPRNARFRGERRYFTGKPCLRGHIAPRRVSDTRCVQCAREKVQEWKKANRGRVATYMRDLHIRRTYGLLPEQVEQLRRDQLYCCAICQQPFGAGRVDVDHNHATGAVRGLLCRPCNKGLGDFKDRIDLLFAAAAYLARKGLQ